MTVGLGALVKKTSLLDFSDPSCFDERIVFFSVFYGVLHEKFYIYARITVNGIDICGGR